MKLPLEEHIYISTRLRYLSVAAQNIPELRVDGKDTDYIITLPGLETTAWLGLLDKFDDTNAASGALGSGCKECHDLCVAVYANFKSSYRTDEMTTKRILALPKGDRSPDKTLSRMNAINALWPKLPNVPGTSGPLVVGGTTAAMFATKTTAFGGKVEAGGLAAGEYAGVLAGYHRQVKGWDTFVSAALVQNRPLYEEGSPERAVLDRIPTAPATQKPDQAIITLAESPARGVSHLLFGAEHGTSFEVWVRVPGATEFARAADVLQPGEYSESGLAGGDYEYKVVPFNSQGAGPASAVAVVSVIAVGAPGVPSLTPPESIAPGESHFQMEAEGATEFEVWRKGPGEEAYALAVTVPASVDGEGEYSASSQPAGATWYKVRALNAEGPGPFSAPVSLEVQAAAA